MALRAAGACSVLLERCRVDRRGEGVAKCCLPQSKAPPSESDPRTLIHLGLSFIPAFPVAKAVRYLLDLYEKGVPWQEAPADPATSRRDNFTDAPQNIAFTPRLVYGNDFGDSLLKATNCGYDTDCTAATLPSSHPRADGIPGRWRPAGDYCAQSSHQVRATGHRRANRTHAGYGTPTVAHWRFIGKGNDDRAGQPPTGASRSSRPAAAAYVDYGTDSRRRAA